MTHASYDLRHLTEQLTTAFPQIAALYLFGSRRYRTGSLRSDVDILVELADAAHVRPNDLRNFVGDHCPALDLFIVDGGKATSCANESFVRADSLASLVSRLEAICFWTRLDGARAVDIDWQFKVPSAVAFVPTAMITEEPIPGHWPRSFRAFAKDIESAGLPVQPYIGSTVVELADFLIRTVQNLISTSDDLNPRGKGWKVLIKTEYDFQNLFFISIKPWLPSLGREELTIAYDGQTKTADFNLFSNKIIFEMKHITDTGTKAAVAKTLKGLGSFYRSHPNVEIIVFAVFVAKDVDLDEAKWESDFSFTQRAPQVLTRIFREP